MTAAVDDMERLVGEAGAFAARVNAELAPMLKDRAAPREAIEAKFGELNTDRAVLAEKVFSAHLALKAAATPGEWKKLRKVPVRAKIAMSSWSVCPKTCIGLMASSFRFSRTIGTYSITRTIA